MAKPGRKRKAGIKRYPNGQPHKGTLDEQKDNAKATVLGARVRIYGLSKLDADTDLAGYEIGRMALAGMFGRDDRQRALSAVSSYCEAIANYMRIKVPTMPIPKAMDYLAGRGLSLREEPSLKSVDRIVKRYDEMKDALAPASGIERMHFHEVAFHDRSCGTDAQQSVIRCVKLLMDA